MLRFGSQSGLASETSFGGPWLSPNTREVRFLPAALNSRSNVLKAVRIIHDAGVV